MLLAMYTSILANMNQISLAFFQFFCKKKTNNREKKRGVNYLKNIVYHFFQSTVAGFKGKVDGLN